MLLSLRSGPWLALAVASLVSSSALAQGQPGGGQGAGTTGSSPAERGTPLPQNPAGTPGPTDQNPLLLHP